MDNTNTNVDAINAIVLDSSEDTVSVDSVQSVEPTEVESTEVEPTEAADAAESEEVMNPWMVKGKMNYTRLSEQFGTDLIGPELIERFERVTKHKAHHWIRRGIVFSSQSLTELLDDVEAGRPVYIYTGRGPSSESMHLGHLVPFEFTRYLQEALNCMVVIQMSDDEKFLFKGGVNAEDLEYYHGLSRKNARDIIACGFDPEKTLIFSNLESNQGKLYFNNVLISNSFTVNQIKGIFGLGEGLPDSVIEHLKTVQTEDEQLRSDLDLVLKKFSSTSNTIGQAMWPVYQMGPALCTSFNHMFVPAIKHALTTNGDSMPVEVAKNLKKILGELLNIKKTRTMRCIITMAIDQSVYFRALRKNSEKLGFVKGTELHSEFLPPLVGDGKMSSTDNANATLFLDMDPNDVKKTIKRHAFSGGRDTLEQHRELGGDIRVDICYQYLTYFLEDDAELERIANEYSDGTMTSGELKEYTAEIVSEVIRKHQEAKAAVTDEVVEHFFNTDRILDIGGTYDRPELDDESYTNYPTYGVEFDRTFGCVPRCERS